jgi:hypothetical protein
MKKPIAPMRRRTGHARFPSDRRRALELMASFPSGCTRAPLAAHDIPTDVPMDLIRTRLAIAHTQRIVSGGYPREVTVMRIIAAGRRVFDVRS